MTPQQRMLWIQREWKEFNRSIPQARGSLKRRPQTKFCLPAQVKPHRPQKWGHPCALHAQFVAESCSRPSCEAEFPWNDWKQSLLWDIPNNWVQQEICLLLPSASSKLLTLEMAVAVTEVQQSWAIILGLSFHWESFFFNPRSGICKEKVLL